jgi:hypothetical protein
MMVHSSLIVFLCLQFTHKLGLCLLFLFSDNILALIEMLLFFFSCGHIIFPILKARDAVVEYVFAALVRDHKARFGLAYEYHWNTYYFKFLYQLLMKWIVVQNSDPWHFFIRLLKSLVISIT